MLTHFFSGATFPAGVFLFVVAPFWSCSFPGRLFRPGPAVFCFFCCGPARTLGPGRRCLPPGWCFFCCCGPARTGVVFLFAVAPPGGSLTHCRLGRFRQGPGGVFFFWLRPRRTRRANSKKCLVYYIGSKRPGGATAKKKKNTTSRFGILACIWQKPAGLAYISAKSHTHMPTTIRRVTLNPTAQTPNPYQLRCQETAALDTAMGVLGDGAGKDLAELLPRLLL